MFKKLKALWLLYKCHSFYIVTLTDEWGHPNILQVYSNMSEDEIIEVNKGFIKAVHEEYLKQKQAADEQG